jgi:hypothetical protein
MSFGKIGKDGGSIIGTESNEEVSFRFRKVSYRKITGALLLLETPATGQERIANTEQAFNILVDNPKVLDEGTFAEVQKILQAAITFNQVDTDDEKKSE